MREFIIDWMRFLGWNAGIAFPKTIVMSGNDEDIRDEVSFGCSFKLTFYKGSQSFDRALPFDSNTSIDFID
jgi:hypothetical protein